MVQNLKHKGPFFRDGIVMLKMMVIIVVMMMVMCRLSSTSQFLHWEEGRAACVCLASLGALLLCWGPLASVSTVHLVTLLVSVFRSNQEGAQFNLPVWAAPLLLLLSLLYPLLSSFIFAYRHRKIRLEVLFMLGISSGEITTHMK